MSGSATVSARWAERLLRRRCRDVPPAGQSLSLLRQRKEPKFRRRARSLREAKLGAHKGDPAVAPYAALRTHTEARAASAEKKELALLAFGQRCSNSFFLVSAAPPPALARHTGGRAFGSLRIARRALTGRSRSERLFALRAPSEPSSSTGQDGKRETDCLSPQGEFEVFPGLSEQRRAVAKGYEGAPSWPLATGEVGPLSSGDFPLGKQRKVTARPGAHPGTGRQAASARRADTRAAPRNHRP